MMIIGLSFLQGIQQVLPFISPLWYSSNSWVLANSIVLEERLNIPSFLEADLLHSYTFLWHILFHICIPSFLVPNDLFLGILSFLWRDLWYQLLQWICCPINNDKVPSGRKDDQGFLIYCRITTLCVIKFLRGRLTLAVWVRLIIQPTWVLLASVVIIRD